MAEYWRVSPRIWMHEGWDDKTRLLALYILTCPHRTTEGFFRLPKEYICADLGWDMKALAIPFRKLLEDGFILYDDTAKVILIRKALKYQRPDNPKQHIAAIRQLSELPENGLWSAFIASAEEYAKGFAIALRKAFRERFAISPAPAPAPTPTPTPAPALSQDIEQRGPGEGGPGEEGDWRAAPVSADADAPAVGPDEIAELWNTVCSPPLSKVTRLTPRRRQHVRARLAEAKERHSLDWWRAYFQRIRASPFLLGEGNRGWRADFDWAIRSEDVVVRVLEGRYDGPSGGTVSRGPVLRLLHGGGGDG